MKPVDADALLRVRTLALALGTFSLGWLLANLLGSLADLTQFLYWPHHFFAMLLRPLLGIVLSWGLWRLAPRLVPALTRSIPR